MTDKTPRRSRPHMPAYGINTGADGMLDWTWADEQLNQARNYWICTSGADGLPHAAPVWGVWLEGTLYFGCARSSRKARNIQAQPEIVAHLESGDDVVILEGRAAVCADAAILTRMIALYNAKYPGTDLDPASDPDTVYIAFAPRIAFGWLERDFPKTATRWHFTAES